MENSSFDPTTVNETTITSMLNLSSSNYKSLKITNLNNTLSIILVGKNQWDQLAVSGTLTNMQIHDKLVLWYNFMPKTNADSDKTVASDLSGNNNNGTLTNFAFAPSSGYNLGLFYDGSDDYISIPTVNFSNLTNATISFWRKADEVKGWILFTGTTASYYVMATSGSGAFYHMNTGALTKTVYVDGVVSNYPINDGLWHHYLITGVNLSAWTRIMINNYAGFQYYDYLGDVKIYNKAFTASEVLSNYNAEKQYYGF